MATKRETAFRESDISRNNYDRAAFEVAQALEAARGVGPTGMPVTYGTFDTAEGLDIDPMSESVQRPTEQTMTPKK